MLRKLLTIVLPIALPFLVYFAYVAIARWRARHSAQAPSYSDGPWLWLGTGGVALMAAALIAWRLLSDPAQPGDRIIPDRLIDGEIQPSQRIER